MDGSDCLPDSNNGGDMGIQMGHQQDAGIQRLGQYILDNKIIISGDAYDGELCICKYL